MSRGAWPILEVLSSALEIETIWCGKHRRTTLRPFLPGFSCMTTRPGALPVLSGMSSKHAGWDERVLRTPAWGRDHFANCGDAQGWQHSPHSDVHGDQGCSEFLWPCRLCTPSRSFKWDAATICYYKGCFGQKAYEYTPIHASYSPAANEINCEVQGEALLQRLERESIRIKMQWQAVTCLSEMSHSLVKHYRQQGIVLQSCPAK